MRYFGSGIVTLGKAEAEAVDLKERSPNGLNFLARRASPFECGGFSPAP
jgi:hypothetical protein